MKTRIDVYTTFWIGPSVTTENFSSWSNLLDNLFERDIWVTLNKPDGEEYSTSFIGITGPGQRGAIVEVKTYSMWEKADLQAGEYELAIEQVYGQSGNMQGVPILVTDRDAWLRAYNSTGIKGERLRAACSKYQVKLLLIPKLEERSRSHLNNIISKMPGK